MSRLTRSLLSMALAGSLALQAFSQDNARRTLKGWGEVIDPDGDCRIALEGGKVTIAIPPVRHDLSVEAGDVNAPRLLRKVEGDFIAQVKIAGNVRHNGERTSGRYLAYHGAGLLLWQDDRNYIRLERAAIVGQDGSVLHYANFDLRRDGEVADNQSTRIPDQDTYLRLERRGDRVFGYVSGDGEQWRPFKVWTVDLGKDVKLGIDAINTSTERFQAEFSEFEVFLKQTGP